MTTQLSFRLPDHVVEYLDGEVRAGRASSRASYVASVIEADMRRRIAEGDAKKMLAQPDADLEAIVSWMADHGSWGQ